MSRPSKIIVSALVLLWLIVGLGCADDCQDSETEAGTSSSCKLCEDPPPDCSGEIPGTATLSIRLSEPLPRWVRIYAGKAYETGTLVGEYVPKAKSLSMDLARGDYAVTALYVTGMDTVLAVDGDELGYRKLWTCTKDCYVPVSGSVDLAVD